MIPRFALTSARGFDRLVRTCGAVALLLSASIAGAAEPAAGEFAIVDGYVREMPPGHPVSGAFFTLVNRTQETVRIVGGRCDCADRVELHEHVQLDGAMRMQPVAAVELHAGERFVFKPGAHHAMLIGLTRPLQAGDDVMLTLTDAEGRDYRVRLPVTRLGANQPSTEPAGHHHH